MLQYNSTSALRPGRSRRLLQKLLRLIDLGSQVRAPSSIGMVQHHEIAVVLPDPLLGELALAISVVRMSTMQHHKAVGRRGNSPQLQNQRRLLAVHLRLESAFVVCLPQRSDGTGAAAVFAHRYESGSSLGVVLVFLSCPLRSWSEVLTRKAAAATPTPIATTEAMVVYMRPFPLLLNQRSHTAAFARV